MNGFKRIENRYRNTHYRGPLAIHASRSKRYKEHNLRDLLPQVPAWEHLECGAIVGTVHLVDSRPFTPDLRDPLAFGPWCWFLENPQRIEPVPYKGYVSFFNVPDDLIRPIGLALA